MFILNLLFFQLICVSVYSQNNNYNFTDNSDQQQPPCIWNDDISQCEISSQIVIWNTYRDAFEYLDMVQCTFMISLDTCLTYSSTCQWTQNNGCDVSQQYLKRYLEGCKLGHIPCSESLRNYEDCSQKSFQTCEKIIQNKQTKNNNNLISQDDDSSKIMYWALYKTDTAQKTQENSGGSGDLGLVPAVIVPLLIFILLFFGIFICFVRKRWITLVRVERQQTNNQNNINNNNQINQNNNQINLVVQNGGFQTSEIIDRLGVHKFEIQKDDHDESMICAICLEKFREGEDVVTLHCKHVFHKMCIEKWVKAKGFNVSCPLCNMDILDNQQNNNNNIDN